MRRVYLKRSAIVARGTDDNQAIMPPEPEPEPEPDHFSDDAAPPTPVPPEVAAELELD